MLRGSSTAHLTKSFHAGYTGAILSLFGLLGFLGLRPPGLIWALTFVLPMTLMMVSDALSI